MERQTTRSGKNVFSGRNFRLVFFGALVSELGALLYSFAVGFYILEITDNNAFLQGLYLALCGAALLLFTPIGGVLGDRWRRERIMFICDYIKGGLILLATLGTLLLRERAAHLTILFAVGILGNAVSGVFSPASGALLPQIVEEDKLQQANSYFTIKSSLEGIFGVVLAGVLYAALPIHALFLLVGICYMLSGVSEMFIRCERPATQEKLTLRLALSDMGEGLRYLRSEKAIMTLVAAILFINFFFAPVSGNFIPYFVKTDLAGAPSYLFDRVLTPELWSSVFDVLIGISSLVSAVALSAQAQPEKCGRQIAKRLCAMAGVMIAATVSYWLLVDRGTSLNAFLLLMCLGMIFVGVLVTTVNIPANTMLMRSVEQDKLSKVSSIVSIASQGLVPIAAVLAGSVLQSLGSTVLLLLCAVGFTITALGLLSSKRIREI